MSDDDDTTAGTGDGGADGPAEPGPEGPADGGAGTLRTGLVEPALETARLGEGYLLKRGGEYLARRGCGVFRHSCAPFYPPLRVAFRCRRARPPQPLTAREGSGAITI